MCNPDTRFGLRLEEEIAEQIGTSTMCTVHLAEVVGTVVDVGGKEVHVAVDVQLIR